MKDSTCHWDMCKWKYVACTDLCSDPATGCTLCNVIPVQTHKGRRMWVQVWDTHTDSSTACLIYGSVDTGLSQISVSAYTVSKMCRFFLYVMIIKFLVKITVSVFQIHFGWWSLLVNCKIPCLHYIGVFDNLYQGIIAKNMCFCLYSVHIRISGDI